MTTETISDWSSIDWEEHESPTATVYPFPGTSWREDTVDTEGHLESSALAMRALTYRTPTLRNALVHSRETFDSYLEHFHAGTAGVARLPTFRSPTTSRLSDELEYFVRRLLEDAASTVLAGDVVRLRSDYLPQMFEDPDPQVLAGDWMERLSSLSVVEDDDYELPWTQDD